MEQVIKLGELKLADLSSEKEAELLDALQKRAEERKMGGSDFVIVRSDRAGVFFGQIIEFLPRSGIVVLNNCRRLWYWSGAFTLSQLSQEGTEKSDCKFSQRTNNHAVLGVIEVLVCSEMSAKKINAIKEHKA